MPTKRVLTKPHAASLDPFLLETFESFYLEKEAGGLAPKTLKNYRQSFEFFAKFCGFTEETTVPEVEQTMIFKWINTMKLEGVKPTSINHYLRDLREEVFQMVHKPSFPIPHVPHPFPHEADSYAYCNYSDSEKSLTSGKSYIGTVSQTLELHPDPVPLNL